MNKKYIILSLLFVAICGALLFYILTGGKNSSDEPQSTVSEVDASQTTAEVLQSESSFSKYNEAVTVNELAAKLDEEITLFVPNNDAFNNLPEGNIIKETLNKDITSYHMANGVVLAGELTDKQKLMTVSGQELIVSIEDGVTYILDAKGNKAIILSADLKTSNGVIHEIDRVLLTQ